MRIETLVVVVLRLLALDFLLRCAVQLTPLLMPYLISTHGAEKPVVPWFIAGALIISAIALWLGAPLVARVVTHNVSSTISFGSMSLADCYSIAFIGVGLFYVVSHFPEVLNWGHYWFQAAASNAGSTWSDGLNKYQITQAIVPFVVGAILFVNGRRWGIALAKRHFGESSPETPLRDETNV